jgi:hypothetical protein
MVALLFALWMRMRRKQESTELASKPEG